MVARACFVVFDMSAMSRDYRSSVGGPWYVSTATTTNMYRSSCVETASRCEPECTPLVNEFAAGLVGYDVVISAATVSGLRRSCATGFSGYPVVSCDGDSFSPLTGCCNASEPSVKACTSCNGTEMSDCTAATCEVGFVPGSFSTEFFNCTAIVSCDVSEISAPINGQLGSVCNGTIGTIADGESCDLTCDSGFTLAHQPTC
eukprot:COSAG02_NODE_17540_length_996_cov_53.907469_1_plen_201_part_10